MASDKINTKLQNILKCCKCHETVKDPQTLNCFHCFCNSCKDDLPKTTLDNQQGLQCPICAAFSTEESIESNFLVNELLDLYGGMQSEHTKCEQCLKSSPQWKCLDCKLDLCEDCKLAHLRIPLLKNHRVLERSKVDETIADHLVFCNIHSDEPIKFNCKQCENLLCVNCKVNDHDNHVTESIEKCLERMFEDVRTYNSKMGAVIKEIDDSLEELTLREDEIKHEFDGCRIQAQNNLEEIIQKAKSQYSDLVKQLDTKEQNEVEKLQIVKKEFENKKIECQHVMEWVDTSVETAKGVTLMAEMQTGLLNKVKQLTQFKVMQIVRLDYPSIDSSVLEDHKEDVIGKTVYESKVILKSKSRITFPKTFESLKVGHSVNLAGKCTRMGLVNGKLWCPIADKKLVEIIDLSGKRTVDIKMSGGIIVPRSIQQAANGDIVLASDTGLYRIQPDGSISKKLLNGKFCDVNIDGSIMVALNYGTSEVYVLKHGKSKWDVISHFPTGKENTSELNTILYSNGNQSIFVSDSSHVVQYKVDGSQIKVFDKLNWPYLCEVDAEDKLLIAECTRNHLKLLAPENVDMQQVICPYCCVTAADMDIWVLKASPYQVVNYKSEF